MRSLYWKIFLSFWLATILIIFTTAWIMGQIAQKYTLTAHEQVFMDSYASAAIATYESGNKKALNKWLSDVGQKKEMTLYLLSSKGEIIGPEKPQNEIKEVRDELINNHLSDGIFKSGNLIISHEILSPSGIYYRLAALTKQPLAFFVQIPWGGLLLRLAFAVFISGLICYMLSRYLTKSLRSLGQAAQSIATGNLTARVGPYGKHNRDEIADLYEKFNQMAEEIEQLVTSKERLLQDISHELRSPLARLQIALALGTKKSNSLTEVEFDRMELECERLNGLIGEILEFARLDKSTTEMQLTEVDLNDLLEEIIQDGNFESGEYNYRIQKKDIAPCKMLLDKRLMHRAIENIIRNALRYTPNDLPIFVSLEINKSNKEVYIDIQDQGQGVPEDQLDKIFTPFYRVDRSREKKTGGFGLGLAIAMSAIQLHKGTIIAKNSPQGGLWVRIALPLD